jgi:autotransporter-associated beta strand protein
MKPSQLLSPIPGSRSALFPNQGARFRRVGKLTAVLCLTLLAGSFFASPALGQAYSDVNYWTGEGADPYWPTAANWAGSIPPDAHSLIVLTNSGATGLPGTNGSGAVGTANIVVSNDTRLAALWIVNTNQVGVDTAFHTFQISNGVTLTISNSASFTGQNVSNIVQVCSQGGYTGQWGVQNGLVDQVVYGTIQGEGATLEVICTNGLANYERGNIFVGQGSAGLAAYPTIDPLNAVLDLSGLDTFRADVNRICVAADPARSPFFFHRAVGTFYLAKTNTLKLWAVANAPSGTAINQGILAGMTAQNNAGGLGRVGKVVLGYTNAIFCNTGIGIGIRNSSGWLGFNYSNAPATSVAYFRDLAGTGRQNMWAVGNRLGVTASGATISGELDFSGGTIDALVNQLQVGKSASGLQTYGTVSFGAGTLDVNTLQLGYQTSSGNAAAQGTLNVSNTAVLKVNTSGVLGYIAGNPVAGQTYFGKLNITDGGTVEFGSAAPLTCGVGSSSEIRVLNGSSLRIHSVGSASAPLTYLQMDGSTLTFDRGALPNPTTPMCSVTTLETSGTTTINLEGTALVAGVITLIKYDTWASDNFANLALGSTPTVTGYLSNNVANSSVDLVITSSTATVLKWNGRTNGVDVADWDIGETPNWQGDLVYQQSGSVGDMVRFDDTAAGTTAVALADTNFAPAYIFANNITKSYDITGPGALTGFGGFTKDGSGVFTLGNAGSNSFSGLINLNGGVLRMGGSADRLPVNAAVTLADASGVTLDLNNLDLRLGSLTGGGNSGGSVTLGMGNLSIGAGGGNFAGLISGSGALIKNSTGTQILSGANTYEGGTVISNSGLVAINGAGSGLGSGPVNIGTGGTLQLGNGVVDGNIDAAFITNDGTLNLYPASSYTLAKTVVGSGNLIKLLGNGTTLYITNANAYTGGTSIQQGIIQVSHADALGTGTITVGNATATDTMLALSGDITVTNAIILSGKTGAIIPSPVGINNVPDATTYQASTNTLTGPITVLGATCWALGSEAGKLIVAGDFINNGSAPLGQFFLSGTGDGLWASSLKDGSPSLKLALDKTEGGTWTLSGTNTFTGRTIVNAGVLDVSGALDGSAYVLVFPGATLAGSGFISGAVTNSGSLFPGQDGTLGTLTVSNALFQDYGSSAIFDVGNSGNDQVRGLTTVVYGGVLKVNVLGTLGGNCVFKLFDAQSYGGAFDGFDLPDISPLSWDTSQLPVNGTLRAVGGESVTPTITSVSVGDLGSISLAGTGTIVAPYGILASTNVALPLSEWVNIGGGTFSNGLFLYTDLQATNYPQRYYRVVAP